MVREIDLDMDWPYQVALPDESGGMIECGAPGTRRPYRACRRSLSASLPDELPKPEALTPRRADGGSGASVFHAGRFLPLPALGCASGADRLTLRGGAA